MPALPSTFTDFHGELPLETGVRILDAVFQEQEEPVSQAVVPEISLDGEISIVISRRPHDKLSGRTIPRVERVTLVGAKFVTTSVREARQHFERTQLYDKDGDAVAQEKEFLASIGRAMFGSENNMDASLLKFTFVAKGNLMIPDTYPGKDERYDLPAEFTDTLIRIDHTPQITPKRVPILLPRFTLWSAEFPE